MTSRVDSTGCSDRIRPSCYNSAMKTAIKSIILAVIAANMLLIASIVSGSVRAAEPLVRITTSFELKHTEAVLRRVPQVFSAGIQRAEADRLARENAAMPADMPKAR